MSRARSGLLVVIAFTIVNGLSPSETDAQSTVSLDGSRVSSTVERHCIAQAPRAGTPQPSDIPTATCFPTFAEAIAAATGGGVMLAADARPSDFRGQGPAGTLSSTVIGIDYVDVNFQGSTLTWFTDNAAGCNDGTQYIADAMPAGWDNVVSSASAWAGCNVYVHYDYPGRAGTQLYCGCSSMGVMNDATSSESWRNSP